jgi:hypothetical protein
MKIMKTLVGMEGEPHIVLVDTIEHEGKLWLVPKWLESPTEGVQRPERIVRIDTLQKDKIDRSRPNALPADHVLNAPMPRSVLQGPIQPGKDSAYEVIPQPDIEIPLPTKRKH